MGDRIRLARDFAKLSQVDLASHVGVSQSTIAYVESERFAPSEELLRDIARTTGFSVSFFRRGELEPFPLGSLLFRARTRVSSGARQLAHSKAQVIWELAQYLLLQVRPWAVHLPQLPQEPADLAADVTRASLGLSPETPARSLIEVLEHAGVLTIVIDMDTGGLDGFCAWAGTREDRPVIVVSASSPGDRLRWSVAHELGHLVLHRAAQGRLEDLEHQADAFAAQFLTPKNAMRRELISPVTLSELASLKARWQVSIQSLVRRAKELDIITDRQYRYLFEQIAKFGWRTHEPVQIAREQPAALGQLISAVYGPSADPRQAISEAGLPLSIAHSVVWQNGTPSHTEKLVKLVKTRKMDH